MLKWRLIWASIIALSGLALLFAFLSIGLKVGPEEKISMFDKRWLESVTAKDVLTHWGATVGLSVIAIIIVVPILITSIIKLITGKSAFVSLILTAIFIGIALILAIVAFKFHNDFNSKEWWIEAGKSKINIR